jgi:hypothetical protein
MKKKILFVSILAALLMVSMPFVSTLQAATVPVTSAAKPTTITSVQLSNPEAKNIQSINLQAITTDINSIMSLSANPDTATPQQMVNIIQLSIKVLKNLGYNAEATSFNQQLQTIIGFNQWGTLRCDLVMLTTFVLAALGAVSVMVFGVLGFLLGITTQDGLLFFGGLGDALAALALLFEIRWGLHCIGTGSASTPMSSTSTATTMTSGCSLCSK